MATFPRRYCLSNTTKTIGDRLATKEREIQSNIWSDHRLEAVLQALAQKETNRNMVNPISPH